MKHTRGFGLSASMAIGAIAVATLGGCAPAVHPSHTSAANHAHSSSPAATPTPTPTATFPPAMPVDALLQITAVVTAPGGAGADLVQTVYLPTTPTAAQESLLDSLCRTNGSVQDSSLWAAGYPNALMLTSTMTATLLPGSPAWDNTKNLVTAGFPAAAAFTGAYRGYQAPCTSGFITIPGTQQALAPIPKSNPSGGVFGWAGALASYGFDTGGNSDDQGELQGNATVSQCTITLSPTAAANPVAAGWAKAVTSYTKKDACGFYGPQ